MRPLFHPSIDDITVEGILHALSDPVRASIYARLAGLDCAATCTALQQAGDRTIPKSSLSQHFRVLREAGLIRSERAGVEMHNTTRCAEIEQRFPGLIPAILKAHRAQMAGTLSSRPPSRRTAAAAVRKRTKAG
ncbi:ArsR/SmtB family transcription factor [Rhodanobacter aciditrophus]|uniref:ArsR/SmtB family transcription factor n=1 Tax=Rhodanobacter aciditrophus TaxID=1623218 RepID=UPI003CE90B2E